MQEAVSSIPSSEDSLFANENQTKLPGTKSRGELLDQEYGTSEPIDQLVGCLEAIPLDPSSPCQPLKEPPHPEVIGNHKRSSSRVEADCILP